MTGERLQRAWGGHGEGPCATFECPMQARCAANETACFSFATFVRSGRVIRPGARFIKSAGVGRGPRIEYEWPPEPKKAIYAEIFTGDDGEFTHALIEVGADDVGVQVDA